MKLKHFFLFVILSLVLSFSGISCNGNAEPSSQTPSTPQTPVTPVELDDSLTAMKLAKAMECGWNLGNTLDAYDNWSVKTYPFNQGVKSEEDWGEEKTTKAVIETGIKKGGYKTIRIPVTWSNHLKDTNYTIDPAWMARVKQVVDWAYDAGYYVILNEHHSVHDNMSSPLKKCEGYIVTTESAEESKAFLKAIWTQICQTFNNGYDEHLIFETMNEPRDTSHEHCWDMQPDTCATCKAEVELLNEYNQLILKTIRASGGNNAERFVMVPATGTGITEPIKDCFKMPTDTATDKLLLTVHMYPLDSGGTGHGSHHFDTTTKNSISHNTKALYDKFVSKGIPVVIGECGAARKAYEYDEATNGYVPIEDYVVTFEDRLQCFSYFAEQAGEYTMPFINWDCGGGEGMATVDRANCKMFETDENYVASIIKAWKDGNANAGSAGAIEAEEVSFDGLNVWDDTISSFDKTTGLLTLGGQWAGANIWLGEKDISDFKTVELTYKNASAEFQFYVRYTDDTNSSTVALPTNSTKGTITLDSTKKLKMIFFQSKTDTLTVTLEKIILKP